MPAEQGPQFTIDVAQNPKLAPDASEMHAIVTVSASGEPAPAASAAEVIIVDCSASMYRPSKLSAAKQATVAAVEALRESVAFAVIAGNDSARTLFPAEGQLAIANEYTKAAARNAIDELSTSGGTAMGQWLRLADQLLDSWRTEVRHAILLTDGRNASEPATELAATLDELRGRFVCDCRGVGTDWEVGELRQISQALLGSVDIVAEPADLAEDFRAMTEAAMDKAVGDVALRLWVPQGADIVFVKQVEPALADLVRLGEPPGQQPDGPRTIDYPTGAWAAETRAYHVCVRVRPAEVGDTMLACRTSIVSDGGDTVLAKDRVIATWSDDTSATAVIDPLVAHYTGQAELAAAIHAGLAARRDGDIETATTNLGRAVALANRTGHHETAALLTGVVDVQDAVNGTVQLKSSVSAVDEMTLDTRSTVTKRVARRG